MSESDLNPSFLGQIRGAPPSEINTMLLQIDEKLCDCSCCINYECKEDSYCEEDITLLVVLVSLSFLILSGLFVLYKRRLIQLEKMNRSIDERLSKLKIIQSPIEHKNDFGEKAQAQRSLKKEVQIKNSLDQLSPKQNMNATDMPQPVFQLNQGQVVNQFNQEVKKRKRKLKKCVDLEELEFQQQQTRQEQPQENDENVDAQKDNSEAVNI